MKESWANPEIQQLNRLPMRSSIYPYADESNALYDAAKGPEYIEVPNTPYVKSLDGQWNFKLLQSPSEDFAWTDKLYDDSSWDKIKVPLSWTMQGYDKPHYTNVQMPFDTVPPNVPQENPAGLYRLSVKVPSEWKNRRVVLHIGSSESCTFVFVNGKQVGLSKDTRLPCEFNVSPYLEWVGEECNATICIMVVRYSDASFVEDQDQWWFGGIHRSVWLYATEEFFIQDVTALATAENISDDGLTGTGVLPLTVSLGYESLADCKSVHTNAQMDKKSCSVKYLVYEALGNGSKREAGKLVASGTIKGSYNYRETLRQCSETIRIENARLWSSEKPELYLVSVSLYDDSERFIESTAFVTGFKTVEIKDRELLINGKKVYIHGVNRHEHNEYNAKTLTTAEMSKDLHILKQYNFNAVRTCHYPDDERWYDLCDRYGMYLLDEANIENHAYYDNLTRSDEWTYAYMTRVQRMVRRDKNHVSIFGWSLGNESGDGANQVACSAWIRRVDPTRIVHYEGFVRPEIKQGDFTLDSLARGKGLTDLISPMYPSIDLIVEYAETRDDYRPIIMCEYSHAMGNANGSLADYWKAIESHHGLQGGFIWDWIDQGLAAEEPEGDAGSPQGGKYWKYGGDFGDTPCDYDFCLNGLMFPDQSPKPAMEECKKLFAPVKLIPVHKSQGVFEVQNKFDFTELSLLDLNWKVLVNGKTYKDGTLKLEKVSAGKRCRVNIPQVLLAREEFSRGQEIVLAVDFVYNRETNFAEAGDVCASETFLVQEAQSWQNFAGDEFISEKLFEDAKKVVEGFEPVLFRPMIENEGIKKQLNEINDKNCPWCFNGKPTREWINSDMVHTTVTKDAEGNFVLSSGSNALEGSSVEYGKCEFSTEEIDAPNGSKGLIVHARFTLNDTVSEYPRVGLSVPLSADYKTVSWYGMGPHECYTDRMEGALLGTHEMPIAELEVPYIVPQENGSRCGVQYIELSASDGRKLHVQSITPLSFNISRYTMEDIFTKHHHNELTDITKGKDGRWILTLDAAHRGVGTGACGPDTMEQYRVRPGVYAMNFIVW